MTRPPTRQERLRSTIKTAMPPVTTIEGKLPARPAKKPRDRVVAAPAPERTIMLSLQTVELRQLRLSPLNVRKTNIDEDIAALAEDIAAHGLKQNLVVIPSTSADLFEVVAGGRRLQALHYLVDAGTLKLTEQIPVLLEDRSEGRATSLSENLHRIAMNPADEFVAFAAIRQDHHAEPDPILYCARRFGVSRGHVEQRLRLANLAPDVLEALRDGRIGVEAAKAYASFENHALQLIVFKAEEKKTWGVKHDTRSIRDALKSKTYPAGIMQAVYVGLDNYFAAGGRSEREMFMGAEEGERLTDPSLIDKLARDKAMGELPDLVARDGFMSGLLTDGFSLYPRFPKAPDGFIQAYGITLDQLTPGERAEQIGVYTLAPDGSELRWHGICRPVRPSSTERSPIDFTAERIAQQRRNYIQLRAAILTVPDMTGTPLDGCVMLPEPDDINLIEPDEESDDVFIYIKVRLRAEDLAEHEAEAVALVEAEEAAEAEAARISANGSNAEAAE